MLNLNDIDSSATYAVTLWKGGSILGTLIYPVDSSARDSAGGYEIRYRRTTPQVDGVSLHLFTIDAGIGVYEVTIPLSDIRGLFRVPAFTEVIIETPDDDLWRTNPARTWRLSATRVLLDRTADIIKASGLSFRQIVRVPDAQSFPHPVTFPRYGPIRPLDSTVLYIDHDIMGSFLYGDKEAEIIKHLVRERVLPMDQARDAVPAELVTMKGALGFFDPPQKVTWRGEAAELAAISEEPFQRGVLKDPWILGSVRPPLFTVLQEVIERLASPYLICGVWKDWHFQSEYGEVNRVLMVGAAVFVGPEPTGLARRRAVAPDAQAENEGPVLPEPTPKPVLVLLDLRSRSVRIQGQTISATKESIALLLTFWRLKKRGVRFVTDVDIQRAGGQVGSRTIAQVRRGMNKVLGDLIAFNPSRRSWSLGEIALPRVFVSYARENQSVVRRLMQELIDGGFDVWWDQDLVPGRNWELQISKVISDADFALICLSAELSERARSGVYPELRMIVSEYTRRHPQSAYLQVVKLSACQTPEIALGGVETLPDLQYTALYPEESDWEAGFQKLVTSMLSHMAPRALSR